MIATSYEVPREKYLEEGEKLSDVIQAGIEKQNSTIAKLSSAIFAAMREELEKKKQVLNRMGILSAEFLSVNEEQGVFKALEKQEKMIQQVDDAIEDGKKKIFF